MSKSENEKTVSSDMPFNEDEFFICFELNNASTAQLLYYRAVILPDLEHVIRRHAKNLLELREKEVE